MNLKEFYYGRKVYPVDTEHPLSDISIKLVVLRVTKKGYIFCSCSDGKSYFFKPYELNVIYEY